nr:VWA domain-containing protein [Oscillospiraceae bacterium]
NPISNDIKQMLTTDPESFLIALSAVTANKSVSGSSSSPLDTMLVLDVSGSMQGNNAVAMVQATNQAIETLLKQNTNNRIGVVLYSGNHSQGSSNTDTASVLLPLGRYTTTNTMNVGRNETIPAYLTISGSGNSQTVSVASSVNNGNSTDSKTVRGGTYIQNGLYQAWEEFEAVTDTKVPAGQVQAGAQRTPVVILMSDGAPTAATTSYNNVQTSNMGNGSSTNDRIAFVTQLTAAWVRSKVGDHYKTTPLFYTLGVGTGNSSEATSVLNPKSSNDTLNDYWSKYLAGTNGQNVTIIPGNWQNNSWSVYKDANVTAQNYVDNYWLANNASGLLDAFKQIVDNIVLQAEQHSTLVEAEQGADMSGYVTFEDELGELMEVKTIKGLVIGNMIFTGAEMAKGFNKDEMGTVEEPTAYGDEFIATVKERLGITDTAVAQQLVANAYNAGQLKYTSATEYSNYIGWYADEDGNYQGFWQASDGYGAEAAPEGAVYINKSYGYLGAQSNDTDASDMMHVVVMVHTRISDGHQTIVYKIPASLIPTVTYHVELNSNDPSDVKNITREAANPMRLLVEVGIREEINAVNLEAKIAEHVAKGG